MVFVYIVLALALTAFVCLMLFAWAIEKVAFGKRCEGNPLLHYFTAADFEHLRMRPVEFQGNRGQTLHGGLYSDATCEQARALLIFVHGMGGGHISYTTEIDYFAKRGYLVLAYDATGTMASEGKALFGMPQGVSDLQSALAYVKENDLTKNLPVLLAGHSWGGYCVCRVLQTNPQVKGVVSFSAPDDVPELLTAQASAQIGHSMRFLKPFLRLWEHLKFGAAAAKSTAEHLLASDVPVLLLHGAADTVVPLSNAVASNKALQDKSNIRAQIFPEKQHNVYASLEAEQYIAEAFQKLGVLSAKKEDPEAAAAYAQTLNFRKMCEEDPEVMEIAASFLENCLFG